MRESMSGTSKKLHKNLIALSIKDRRVAPKNIDLLRKVRKLKISSYNVRITDVVIIGILNPSEKLHAFVFTVFFTLQNLGDQTV
jgi:hypothetical protein